MSETLRVVLLIGVILYFLVIVHLLRKRILMLKYSLLWLFTGIILIVIDIWPQILYGVTEIMGIEKPVNGLFLITLAFGDGILMSLTVINSKQSNKLKILTQSIALLEKRVRELEEREK